MDSLWVINTETNLCRFKINEEKSKNFKESISARRIALMIMNKITVDRRNYIRMAVLMGCMFKVIKMILNAGKCSFKCPRLNKE